MIRQWTLDTRGQVALELWHRSHQEPIASSKFVIVNGFGQDHPQNTFAHSMFPSIQEAEMADPKYNVQAVVEGILGIDVLAEQLNEGLRRNRLGLIAQSTKFGWIVFGGVYAGDKPDTLRTGNIVTTSDLHAQIRRLWEIDDVEEGIIMSTDEKECEALYQSTVVHIDGRYQVTLLLRNGAELGESRAMARRRLYCLENRFKRDPALQKAYVQFMEEYERLGHMQRAEPLEAGKLQYYIPHHAVAVDRKFRVVFDASAKTTNGKSLIRCSTSAHGCSVTSWTSS